MTMYLAYILPASCTKRAKNDSHFYSRAEDGYKARQIHFSYADTSERKSGNGLERFGKIRSTVVKIDRRKALSRNTVIHFWCEHTCGHAEFRYDLIFHNDNLLILFKYIYIYMEIFFLIS